MRSKFFYLYVLHFFNDGYGAAILLFLPFISKDLHLNLTQVGVLGGGLNLLPIFFALPAIFLADRLGSFKVLLWALLLYGFGFALMAGAGNFYLLLIIFLLIGGSFGLFHPIGFSLVSRWSEKTSIGRNMGNFTAWGDAGRLVLAGFTTFIIVAVGWRQSSLVYGGTALAFFLYVYIFHFRKDYLPPAQAVLHQANFKNLLVNKKFILAMSSVALDNMASNPIAIFLPFLLLAKGISPEFLSIYASVYVLGILLGKALLGRLVDRAGSAQMFMIAEVLMAVFLLVLAGVQVKWLVVLFSLLAGVATKGTVPTTRSMVYETVTGSQNHERAHALNDVVGSTMIVAGSALLGVVSDHFGVAAAFRTAACLCLLAIIPAAIFWRSGNLSTGQ